MVHVEQGQNFILNCTSDDLIGLSRIDHFTWIKDGSTIDLRSASKIYRLISFNELSVNPGVQQSGRYQCKGTIGGLSKLSSFVDVVVFSKYRN